MQSWRQTLTQVDLWQDLDPTRQREVLFGVLRQVVLFRRRGSAEPVAVEFLWENRTRANRANDKLCTAWDAAAQHCKKMIIPGPQD